MAESEERALVLKRLRSRVKLVRAGAIERLCEMFEPLVRAQARSHSHTRVELEDVLQVARVGLLEACNGFVDESKKRKWNDGAFPTYATWCIRNALSKHDETNVRLVKLPAWMHRRMPKLRRLRSRLAQELMREPTADDLAAAMKLPLTAITDMLVYEEASFDLPSEITGSLPNGETKRKRWDRTHRREKL
jgi:RNA polymerase primary sigma factor